MGSAGPARVEQVFNQKLPLRHNFIILAAEWQNLQTGVHPAHARDAIRLQTTAVDQVAAANFTFGRPQDKHALV
jgi:hypothetical protein